MPMDLSDEPGFSFLGELVLLGQIVQDDSKNHLYLSASSYQGCI